MKNSERKEWNRRIPLQEASRLHYHRSINFESLIMDSSPLPDLSLADPTGTLPVLSAVSFWLIFEFSQRASGAPPPTPGTTEAKQMLFMKIVMRASMLGIVPLTCVCRNTHAVACSLPVLLLVL